MYTITGLLGGFYTFATKEELRSWIDGAIQGTYAFAHMKDGVYYVGTTGKTWTSVCEYLENEFASATGEPYKQ